jgi:hypothetical protein
VRDCHPFACQQHFDPNHYTVWIAIRGDAALDAILPLAMKLLCDTPSKLIVLDVQQGFSCPFPNGGAVLLIPRTSLFVVH